MTAVEISLTQGVQTLKLSRPEKRNALTQDMYRMLSDALEAGESDEPTPLQAGHVVTRSRGSSHITSTSTTRSTTR